MNNEILEIPSRAGRENGLRDSSRVCCLLDPAANPRSLRSIHSQLSRKWRGKNKVLSSFSILTKTISATSLFTFFLSHTLLVLNVQN